MNKEYHGKVTQEKSDLDAKIAALKKFQASPEHLTIGNTHQGLLMRQLDYMQGYSEVLAERLAGGPTPEKTPAKTPTKAK